MRNLTEIINDINIVVLEIGRVRARLRKLVDEYVEVNLELSNASKGI